MKEELLKGLSEEQIAKVKACKSQDEMLVLAKEEGVELTDEQLQAVSGGGCSTSAPVVCPKCGSDQFRCVVARGENYTWCSCLKCRTQWTVNRELRL